MREKKNEFVVVETEAFTSGVLYADYFTVINRFCITKRAENRSHLLIKTFINYKKQPNFIAKSKRYTKKSSPQFNCQKKY